MKAFPRTGGPPDRSVVWKAYLTVRSAWAAMMRGEIDFCMKSPEALEFIEPEASVQVFPFLRNFDYAVVFNSSSTFRSQDVRRRSTTIDREALVARALGTRRATSGPAWPMHWARDDRPLLS